MGTALAEVVFKSFDRGAAQRHDAFLVAFAANMDAAGIESQVAGGERRDLRDAQAAGIEEFENGAIAQGGGARLGVRGPMAARSSISATSGSARDLGSTFQALGDSMLTVGS